MDVSKRSFDLVEDVFAAGPAFSWNGNGIAEDDEVTGRGEDK